MDVEAEPALEDVLREHLMVFVPLVLLLPATYFLPPIAVDPDLSKLALSAYLVTESGGKLGIPVVGMIALAAVVMRRQGGLRTLKREIKEAAIITISLGLVLGAVAALNEHAVKPVFAVPRPNIQALCQGGRYALLGTTPEEFYALGDKEVRSTYLHEHVAAGALHSLHLPALIRRHWIKETGYSFPSGHSMASMTFASYFLLLGLYLVRGRRRWAFVVLPFWALGVCASRPLLFVHSWIDVSVGGLLGTLVGLAAFMLARAALKRLPDPAPAPTA